MLTTILGYDNWEDVDSSLKIGAIAWCVFYPPDGSQANIGR